MPSRLHITGASGTGTTTLGKALGRQLGYSVLDADDYFWCPTQPPFSAKRCRHERLRLMVEDMRKHFATIITGSVTGWGPELEDSFDLVIYLWMPPEIRLARLKAREIALRGQVRKEFLEWAARYDEGDISFRSRMLHEQWFEELACPVLRLEGDLSTEERVLRVREELLCRARKADAVPPITPAKTGVPAVSFSQSLHS